MKNESILLSVICPVFNGEKFIKETLFSVISSKNKNVEFIIVNDGSTDNTESIIKNFHDERIKYIYQENSGAPVARNKGLDVSNGKYIYFIDADDIVANNAIDYICNFIKENDKVDLFIGNYLEIDDNAKEISRSKLNRNVFFNNEKKVLSNDDLLLLTPLPGNKIFKKQIIDKYELQYIDVKIGQDLNFYLKFIKSVKNVCKINQILYFYRVHNSGISRTYDLRILDIIKSLEDVERYYNYESKINRLKFFHYYSQFSKIPFVKEINERRLIFSILTEKIDKVQFKNQLPEDKFVKFKYLIKKIVFSIRYL